MCLFFLSHCSVTPLVSRRDMLRTKAVLKMFICLLAVVVALFVRRDLFVWPTFQNDEPVVMMVKYISYSLCVDFVLFGLYLALGFGRPTPEAVTAARKDQ